MRTARNLQITVEIEHATLMSLFGTLTLKGEVIVILDKRFIGEFDLGTKCPKTEACYSELIRLIKGNLPVVTESGTTGWHLNLNEWNIKHVQE